MFLDLTIPNFLAWLNNNIRYGYVDGQGHVYPETELEKWKDNYRLQIEDKLLKTRVGNCWDYVELQRWFFNLKGINHRSYFICDPQIQFTHTFSLFSLPDSNYVYWFESAWHRHRGIQALKNLQGCLLQISALFKEEHRGFPHIYQYEAPPTSLSVSEFLSYCTEKSTDATAK